MKKFYDVRETIKASPLTRLFYCVGQRGVGKTYSAKVRCLEEFFTKRKKFIYVRRWTTEINGRELQSVFSDVMNGENAEVNEWIADYDKNAKYRNFHVLPKAGLFYLVGEKNDGSLEWIEDIGKITCISKAEQFKGGAYMDYTTILFDEFITELGYVMGDREPELFSKIVSSVGRATSEKHNKDLKIILCGNPDASIEANPYLYSLSLIYSQMQPNTSYFYDTKTADGKILADNICFIKLAKFDGEYLNEHTASLFGTSEEAMSTSGDVKTNKYIHVKLDILEVVFEPEFELMVETPIITNTEYHRKLYAYYGIMYGEPVLVVLGHRWTDECTTLYCRYDKNDLRERPYMQTYRINVPPNDALKGLAMYMRYVDATQFIITDKDENATLFEQIKLLS